MSKPEYRIWTIQMAQWRVAKEMGVKLLDCTVKTGIECFAPDYELLLAYKGGRVTESEYTERYLAKMKASQYTHAKYWETLKRYPNIAFACYCKAGEFCHRHLFKELVTEYLSSEFEVIHMGEIQKQKKKE